MTYPGFVTVQVRAELSLGELTALYWDALVDARKGDVEWAARIVGCTYPEYTSSNAVKALVRQWLTWYGERSVECGPKNEYPSDLLERRIKAIVARAYRLTY